MKTEHETMLLGAIEVLEDVLLDNGVDVFRVRQSIIDLQTVLNENSVKIASNDKEMIYQFNDYFPTNPGPKNAA